MIPVSDVVAHRDEVAPFDAADLISTLAGLQLLPANADRLLRLEGGVQTVASLRGGSGGRPIALSEVEVWLQRSPFQVPEDPFNNSFAEEITFVGGSYVVLPGAVEGASFMFRQLAAAIFLSGEWGRRDPFRLEATALAIAALRVSDAVARRAGLERGVKPGSGPLVVPPQHVLDELKSAVVLEQQELEQLFDGVRPDVLDPLTQDLGLPLTTNRERLGTGPFFGQPLIRANGQLIVALPHAILGALLHALVSLAVSHGVVHRLAKVFRAAVFGSVVEKLTYIECPRVYPPLSAAPPEFADAVFSLDADKVVYVLLVTDPLADYDPATIHGDWRDADLHDRMEVRLLEAERELLSADDPPNAVLHLIVVESVGRTCILGFGDRLEPVRSYRLVMSAAELEVICLLEGGHQLALWQFARAADRLRDEARVLSFSELDEFDIYRRNHRSYYLSDDVRPNMIAMAIGGGANLRAEVADRFDFHGAPFESGDSVIEVALLHGERRVPIYIPIPRAMSRPTVLVEQLPLPVWVVAPRRGLELQYRARYAQFADLVSYWLWQITPDIERLLEPLAETARQLVFELELVEGAGWFEDTPTHSDNPIEWEVISDAHVRLTLHPAITDRLSGPDNVGERDLVADLIRAAAAAAGTEVAEGTITEIVDRRAPLGQKKKLVTFRQMDDPCLDDTGLPPFRKVQEADEAEALDDAGRHLVDERGLAVGPVTGREAQRDALNSIVDFHYRELERLVSTLDPSGLLEWLVAFHEAIVAHQALRDLQAPSELACFSSAPRMVERVAKEIPELAQAAISSRFLIEYVVARPPRGLRPMSMSVYDRLLILASEIFNKGSLSDLVHYGLAQPHMSILPSTRLGLNPETVHKSGRERYLGAYAGAELDRRIAAFERFWDRPASSAGPPPELRDLDAAIETELGVSLTDLASFQIEVVNAGLRREGEPKVAPLAELRDELVNALGWPQERVDLALELSTLEPRSSFLNPSPPFAPRDVYPWRFDRRLSYSWRPLVIRQTDGADEVVWGARHVFASSRYFFGLCTNGRLEADTLELKRVNSSLREAREFNDRVAALFAQQRDTTTATRVTKFGRMRIERARGQLISDIDVLVVVRRLRQLLVVETKDLAVARTPSELAHELRELYRGEGGETAAVDRLLEVVQWVQSRRPQVLAALGLPTKDAKRWKVKPLVVVDQELLTPYLFEAPVPTLSYRALEAKLRKGPVV